MWEDKETTAPIPSVAPDGEQPSALARTVSITEIEETHKQFGKIQIMTMPELMETRFRVRPAVIDGLLTAGTYLLAGAPKIGKSFLVLQMAYQVSMGAPFLGFSSRQGTVLYLALEDTCERLQKRLAQMTEQDSEHLILSVFSETLDEGLTERLSDFWSEHTDTVLIIIDTLQRVRGRTPDNGSYAADKAEGVFRHLRRHRAGRSPYAQGGGRGRVQHDLRHQWLDGRGRRRAAPT